MKKVFLDTNILIDVITARMPFALPAANILELGMSNEVELYVSALSFANCVYVGRKAVGYQETLEKMRLMKRFIYVSRMGNRECERALFSQMPDFEDMLQYESAVAEACDVVITRNKKHFPQEPIPVINPEEFLNSYQFTD